MIQNILLLLVSLNPISKILLLRTIRSTSRRKTICFYSSVYTIILCFLFFLVSDFIPSNLYEFLKRHALVIKIISLLYVLFYIILSFKNKTNYYFWGNSFFPFTIPLNIGPSVFLLLSLFVSLYGLQYSLFLTINATILNFLFIMLFIN